MNALNDPSIPPNTPNPSLFRIAGETGQFLLFNSQHHSPTQSTINHIQLIRHNPNDISYRNQLRNIRYDKGSVLTTSSAPGPARPSAFTGLDSSQNKAIVRHPRAPLVKMAANSTVATTSSIYTSSTFSTSTPFTDTAVSTSSIPTTSSIFTTSSTSSPSDTSTAATSSTSAQTSASAVTTTASASVATYTSVSTVSPTGTDTAASVVTVTSTQSAAQASSSNLAESATASTTSSSASSTKSAAALATGGAGSSSSNGLSSGGKIAIAVVVPIVAIAAIVAGLIFFWKRRKARKSAEEERRKEAEEYGYNPNNDPTLPAVGSNYGETQSEMQEDNSGYRGWGTTTASTQRKPSTTMGSASNRGAVGMAVSDTTSNNGYNGQHSEGHSGDPLVTSPANERPLTQDSETIGALGGAPAAGTQNRDINRGPSNASSAYTGHAKSEGSEEGDRSPNGTYGSPNYYEDTGYYNEAQPSHGPYGDGSYGGGQPVIRDVQARRNTRIEKPSVFPQQGNAGISQNF